MPYSPKPPFYVAGSADMELIGTLIDLASDKQISNEECRKMMANGLETLQTNLRKAELDHILVKTATDKRLAEDTAERLKAHLSRSSPSDS